MHVHTQYSTKKKKKKAMLHVFLGCKSILCLSVAYKNINPKEHFPCENQGKRNWVGCWESLCQTQIILQLHMLSRAMSFPQYTYTLWHLKWQYSAVVTREALPQHNSDSAANTPGSCLLGLAVLPGVAQLAASWISASLHFFNAAKPSACTEITCQLQIHHMT